MRLKGKVAIITDAASPRGRAIAERFAAEGAKLAVVYPATAGRAGVAERAAGAEAGIERAANAEAGIKCAAGAGIANGNYCACIDPADKAAVDCFVGEVAARFGRVDILVHTNNDVRRVSFEGCSDDEFAASLDINAKSAFLFTQAAGRRMKDARGGHIVYVSTIHDEKPTGCAFAYSVAKGAVQMLMREAAIDLANYGVCVNSISCGPVEGDDAQFESPLTKLYENLSDRIPLRHAGTDGDFASLAVFLCGDENKFVNGEDIRADGGFVLNYSLRMSYDEYAEFAGAGT